MSMAAVATPREQAALSRKPYTPGFPSRVRIITLAVELSHNLKIIKEKDE
jgi:hypothetical protein